MSHFVVSARKYRPSTFDEVIGQDHVAKTLKNAIQSGQLAHAFLFTGPRGVGKTTCARILAKVINCENLQDGVVACNECLSCTSFNDNASFNIFELDAASNNSVEDIRSLTEQVRIPPQTGKYKVFIIDEVHMLSSAAFNAFLKTLEEPPAHAIFILATTEKHKIIPTILSRCQVFDFKRIQVSDIVVQLEEICKKESINAEKEALTTIAIKADGAMRDALSIFDKIKSSVSNGVITYKDVIDNLNILDYDYYFKITDACLREDIAEVLLTFDQIVKLGFEPEYFVLGLAEHFRDLLISKIPETIQILDVSEELRSRYYNQSQIAQSSFLLSGLNLLNQCDIDLVRAKNKRLQTELVLSKLAYLSRRISTDIFTAGAGSQEKKTEVESYSPVNNTIKAEKLTQNPEPKTPIAVSQSDDNIVQSVDNNTAKEPIKPIKKFGRSNIEDLKAKIRKTEETRSEARKTVTKESIVQIWEEYIEYNNSKSTQAALKLVELDYGNETVFVKVPAQITKDIILQESNLIEKLRNDTGLNNLIVDITIDKSIFPDYEDNIPVQALSQRERYNLLLEKKPELSILAKNFGLKLDNEI